MNNENFAQFKANFADGTALALPRYWKFEINKPLIGIIRAFSHFEHNRYGKQATVIVELESGELVSAILNGYLKEGVVRQDAQVNDFIFINFLGKEYSNNGNFFKKYNMVIQKA